jgi:TolB-like protein/Flp pilus assembly protein TadD
MSSGNKWDEISELFAAARDLSHEEREALFRTRSIAAHVRHEIDELLRAHDAVEAKGDDVFLSFDAVRASLLLGADTIDDLDGPPLKEGDAVGRYRIVRAIGRGGMGLIYLAIDPRLNRNVALKLLPAHMDVDSNARRRFEEEARAASRLDHPHIATVYEVDETADGRLFIAMAYYHGETLREKLKREPFSINGAVALATQIADGLTAAHAAGLVHRDIKPANVIVTQQGVAKIVDFGIARIATEETAHDGATAGTVAYMSPEQTRGEAPSPRMDVWAFGVMLYEMLTGARPFRGESDSDVISAIRNDEPGEIVRPDRGEVPGGLIAIAQRCLRKDADERYRDAGEILDDLRELAHADGDRRAKRGWGYMAAAAVLFVILVGGALWMWKGRGAADALPRSVAVLPFANQLEGADDDHFSAGLADELITELGAIPGLRVAARTSTFALYSSGLDVKSIAERLGVAAILEGSVRGDTARMRISARLVQARDNAVLWSESYDVPMRDVFTVQEQIGRAIAAALDVHLASAQGDSMFAGRPTEDLEAYDLYLRGRHVRTRDTRDRLEQALSYYREAIERDPRFANAYSGLAETYVNLANFGYVSASEGFGNANIAAERALDLNPRLADAYTSHGYVLASRSAFDSADVAFHRAIELNPSSPLGHHYYSLLLAMLDSTDAALEQNRRARELDPLFTPAVADYGIILCQRGQLAAADSALSKALGLEPKFALTLYWLGAVRAARGSYADANNYLEQAARISPDYPGVSGSLAYVYARTGRQNRADSIIARLRLGGNDDRSRANLAFAYAALDKLDDAFALMRELRWDVPSMIGLRADPLLRSLRADPRYAVLVRETRN